MHDGVVRGYRLLYRVVYLDGMYLLACGTRERLATD